MEKSFRIQLPAAPTVVVEKAKAMLEQNGMSLTGDAQAGAFRAGPIEGRYQIEGSEAVVTISKAPFWVPAAMVEAKVREYFA